MVTRRFLAAACGVVLLAGLLVGFLAPAMTKNKPLFSAGSSDWPVINAVNETPEFSTRNILDLLVKAYDAKEYKSASKLLIQLQVALMKDRSKLYRPLLPTAPQNWTARDLEPQTGPKTALMSVAREYKGYDQSVKIGFVLNPTTVQVFSKIIDATTQAVVEHAVADIKGNPASYREDKSVAKDDRHQLTVYAGDVVVMLLSETLPEKTLLDFANLIDYDKLKAIP